MAQQARLELGLENYTVREQWLVDRLEEYPRLPRDMEEQRKLLSGELSRVPISLSGSPPREDEATVMAELRTAQHSDWFAFIIQAVKKHVNADNDMYTDRMRIANRLRYTRSDDPVEDLALQDAFTMLTERESEEFLHLTSNERYAVMREKEVAEAKAQLDMLKRRYSAIAHSLSDMQKYETEWYELLWGRYVLQEKYDYWVNKAGMSEQRYRTMRTNALRQFDQWAIGLC